MMVTLQVWVSAILLAFLNITALYLFLFGIFGENNLIRYWLLDSAVLHYISIAYSNYIMLKCKV